MVLPESEALSMVSVNELAGNAEELARLTVGDSKESSDTMSGEEDDNDAPTIGSEGDSVGSVAAIPSVVDGAA